MRPLVQGQEDAGAGPYASDETFVDVPPVFVHLNARACLEEDLLMLIGQVICHVPGRTEDFWSFPRKQTIT